ncbi:MAG: hypothetical protein ABSA47_03070 [Verrucomicrobiota bacterium]|jgi:hypothetical protein
MSDAAKAELLGALGRLVRGLSILFWGLGLTALVYLETARVETTEAGELEIFDRLAFFPALILSAMLWRGLRQMRAFQPQERIWQRALDRAEALAATDAGLAPFLFWWHKFPAVPLFAAGAGLLLLSSLFLLVQINLVLRRLCAMLPDETLRAETKLFTACNITFLLGVFAGLAAHFLLSRLTLLPPFVRVSWEAAGAGEIWLGLFLVLLPVAMTMALVWKIKEVIFSSLLAAGG